MYFDDNHDSWMLVSDYWTSDTQLMKLSETDLAAAKESVFNLVKQLSKMEN